MFHLCFSDVSFFGFSVQIKHTLREKNQNMLEEISKHARRDATETLKLNLKHPHSMFQLYNLLIISVFKAKNET